LFGSFIVWIEKVIENRHFLQTLEQCSRSPNNYCNLSGLHPEFANRFCSRIFSYYSETLPWSVL